MRGEAAGVGGRERARWPGAGSDAKSGRGGQEQAPTPAPGAESSGIFVFDLEKEVMEKVTHHCFLDLFSDMQNRTYMAYEMDLVEFFLRHLGGLCSPGVFSQAFETKVLWPTDGLPSPTIKTEK
uniref:Uncharacterized protein n=1 Tax=Leersia perrieri TaxID=77586 RepID=A0A0D9UZF0_9ORYZ